MAALIVRIRTLCNVSPVCPTIFHPSPIGEGLCSQALGSSHEPSSVFASCVHDWNANGSSHPDTSSGARTIVICLRFHYNYVQFDPVQPETSSVLHKLHHHHHHYSVYTSGVTITSFTT